ncbi:MAG: hypothetical protein D6784_14055 [Chloroflexi bacterium]|nr:MAG: hypothetical protein D6784_14055 [Chloroflexota bacterium]
MTLVYSLTAVSLLFLLGLISPTFALTTVVYDDTLAGGWSDWSWASVDLSASSPVYSGSASIAVTFNRGWQGLYLAVPGGFPTDGFASLHFFAHGGTRGGQVLNVYAILPDGSESTAVTVGPLPANTWTEIQIPLSSLGLTNRLITGLVWQDASGSGQPTFYLDDIRFSDDAPPDSPVFGTVTLRRSAIKADGWSGAVVTAQVSDPQGAGDIAAVTVDGSGLGQSDIPLYDDGRHNDGAAGDGLFGAVVTAKPGTPPGEVMLTLTARDRAGHTRAAHAGALVVLASPGGTRPASLPEGPAWGTNQIDWQTTSSVPWQYAYQYITYHWYTDGWGGNFVGRYVQQAWTAGYIPVISVYLMLGLPPTCGENADCYAQKLQNSSAVATYLAAITEAARQARGSKPVIFHLEPDFYGYFQQTNYSRNVPQPDSPANYPVALNISGYPNDLRGFGRRIVDVIHQTAPNALVAPHASMWATNADPNSVPPEEVIRSAQSTAAFIGAMGGAEADLYFVEWSDRDSGCDHPSECNPPRPWWDTTNRTLPRPARALLWANALSEASGKRLVLWQVPAGNMGLDNTCQHYRDNRPAYAFSHPRDLADTGILAVLFGGGSPCSTQPNTDGGFILAQADTAYALPAAAGTLTSDGVSGPTVSLYWTENAETDLWGYQLNYQPVGGGMVHTVRVDARNAARLVLPTAGQWQITVSAYDAMGQVGPSSNPVTVTTLVDAERVYLPLLIAR